MNTKGRHTLYKRIGLIGLSFALLCGAVNGHYLLTAFASPDTAASAETTTAYTFRDDSELADFDMWYAPTLTPDGEFPAIGGVTAGWHLSNGTLQYQKSSALRMGNQAMLHAEGDWTEDFKVYKYNTAADTSLEKNNAFNHPTLTAGPLEVKNGVTVETVEGNANISRDFGYLDFVGSFWNGNVTHALTHNTQVTDFYLEADVLIGKNPFENVGGKGIMIAPAGEFAFSADGVAQNDKGVYITYNSNMVPVIVGAIKEDTATVTSGQVLTERKGTLGLSFFKNVDSAVCASTGLGTLTATYKAFQSAGSKEVGEAGKATLCIEVKNGKLSVWNKAAKDANVLTVELSEQYAGGCISYVATSVFSGALCGLRLKDYDGGNAAKAWDYSYAVERNLPIRSKEAQSSSSADASWGEVDLPVGDLFKPDEGNVNTTGVLDVAVDSVHKQVLYKSADAETALHSNYGIALLHKRTYGNFVLDVNVTGNDHIMLGFGAENTSDGVFPSRTKGGFALMLEKDGRVSLIGCTAANTPSGGDTSGWGEVELPIEGLLAAEGWNVLAQKQFGNFTEQAQHHYTLTVSGATAKLQVDGDATLTFTLPRAVEGYIYLAANTDGDGFGDLMIQDGTTLDVCMFDSVKGLDDFTQWYMPVGNATAAVPAIRVEKVTHNGNWYVDNGLLYFMHDPYLYKTAAQLEAGVTLTVPTEAGTQRVAYKSTDDETVYTGNYGIAMLNTRKFTDFRLEVSVKASAQHAYIGFGAKGGSWGAHVGQADGGYAFHAQSYSETENLGIGMLSGYDTQSGGRYDLLRSGNFAYDVTKDHRYVIEVRNGVATVTVDGISVVKGLLPMYEGGYIYLASNDEEGGFYNLQITAPDEETAGLPTDISNTVSYTFDKQSDLDAFESWYVYGADDINMPAIPVTAADGANWYIDKQQTLSFKENSLYALPDSETNIITVKKELTIDGVTQEYTFTEKSNYPTYNANFGIAMLKTPYKNFIMEVDLKPTNRHIYVGFGAKGGHNGVFKTQTDGGYALRLNKDGANDAAKVYVGHHNGRWFAQDASTKVDVAYSEGSYIHLRLVVSDGTAYYYFNGAQTPITATLSDYDGGHIYFAVNYKTGGFDNIRITDLDKKPIVISDLQGETSSEPLEIKRAEDDSLSDVLDAPVSVADRNGYGYYLPVKWESSTYRSYLAGTHDFTLKNGATAWHNVSVSTTGSRAKLTVLNNLDGVDYDPEKSRKYYFDHDNDLLDFISQSSQQKADGTMSGWSAELLPDENCSEWTTAGGVLTNPQPSDPGTYTAENRTTVHSLLLDDLHLYNFRLEMDYRHSETNWWYTYLIFGAQDPSLSYIGLDGDSVEYVTSYAGGRRNPGVWFFVEQEGRMHLLGDVFCSDYLWTESQNFLTDVDGSGFIMNYPSHRNDTHHVTIEVVNGEAWFQVDDSGRYYFIPTAQALGGYMGIANHGNGSTVDNFQITALDENGRSIALADAEQGFAPDLGGDTYTGWDGSTDDFVWSSDYRE